MAVKDTFYFHFTKLCMGKQRKTGEDESLHINSLAKLRSKFLDIECNVAMPSLPDAGSEENVSCSPVKSFHHLVCNF